MRLHVEALPFASLRKAASVVPVAPFRGRPEVEVPVVEVAVHVVIVIAQALILSPGRGGGPHAFVVRVGRNGAWIQCSGGGGAVVTGGPGAASAQGEFAGGESDAE
eukprot:6721315-Heterocapsa_arctica.AAC.1